jgi:hypothetical protein
VLLLAAIEYSSDLSAPDSTYSDSSLTHPAQKCRRVGNADFYGLGIRLGVYLQLFSTLIANHFMPEAAQETWDPNTFFIVAIFIAIIKSSIGSHAFSSFEVFFMLQMVLACFKS